VEEAPSPDLPQDRREAICEAAVRMIAGAEYSGAGTVEFIVDKDYNFYFIEVNARIQVEHPVSEMVAGVDLIQEQIRVAAGEQLSFRQEELVCRGHAIECRINAEDATKNFQPCPGRITSMFAPGGLGVRFDSHVQSGYSVPPYYDSMIGKLIVHRPTREQAIATMLRALKELQIEGITTTVAFHNWILRDKEFLAGTVDTKYVDRAYTGQTVE